MGTLQCLSIHLFISRLFVIASPQRPLDGNSYNLPFAFEQDGTLRLIDIKSNDCKVIEKCSIGVPITSFSFSPTYRHIALGSSRVSIIFMKIVYTIAKYTQGYSIKTYHPGGDPTLKLAKPPLEVQLSVYRPTLEPFSFNTYPSLEEIFISLRMVLVICMYVCM